MWEAANLGWMEGAAGVTAGYQLVQRKCDAAPLEEEGAAAEVYPSTDSRPGLHLLSLSVPSSFLQLVCGSLR